MEMLEYPEPIPPRGDNHFLECYVGTWNNFGKFTGTKWVRCRRNLLNKMPGNCSQDTSHWLHAFDSRGAVLLSIPELGVQWSVMFPGDKIQSYPKDPHFAAKAGQPTLASQRKDPLNQVHKAILTCPSQLYANGHIGDTPRPFSAFRSSQSVRSSTGNGGKDYVVPYPQTRTGSLYPQNLFKDDEESTATVAWMP
jgi:hypothetical protein